MRTITKNIYQFTGLSEEAKEKARQWYRESGEFNHEHILDHVKELAAIVGIQIDHIYYTGFWSQGDGACFEGDYSYKPGWKKKLTDYGARPEVMEIGQMLQDAQRAAFYKLTASVTHRGHYYHENCTDIDVWHDGCNYVPDGISAGEIEEGLRDFMRFIYKTLEKEYEYTQSDEYAEEGIIANEYEFTEDGEIY